MATILYLIGGLADFNSKGSSLVEKAHNRLESSLTKDELIQKEDRILIHQYPQRYCQGELSSTRNEVNRGSGIPVFTRLSAEYLSEDLCDQLNSLNCLENDSLLIIAYSGGSAIFRGAYAKALTANKEKKASYSWLHSLKCVFHIGGMTLGWQFNSEMNKILHWLGPVMRTLPYVGNRIFPFQLYRGSKFIVDTRIAITKHKYRLSHHGGIESPDTIYILGTKDQYISPADAIEPGYAENEEDIQKTTDYQPLYLEASGCNHETILEDIRIFDAVKIAWANISSTERMTSILALSVGPNQLKPIAPTDLDDYLDPLDNCSPQSLDVVKHVVIILHGIRDNGYWAKRISHRIKDKWRIISSNEQHTGNANTFSKGELDEQVHLSSRLEVPLRDKRDLRVVTLSYGYFSLWDFIRPGGRRQAVEWFQNAYADITALYPDAVISFIGHSNGTYLGTEALKCDEISYKLMLLAGSVVRQDFWALNRRLRDAKKVSTLLNIIATQDVIVGLLPGGFERLPFLSASINLGGAGAFGFKGLNENEQLEIRGGHGAGIAEDEWEKIASYVCKIHKDDDQAQQIGKTIGLPVTKSDKGIRMFNNSMRLIRYVSGYVIILAFVLWLLPYLFAVLGVFSDIFVYFSGLPLFSLQLSPYKVFLVLLITSAVVRGLLKRI